MENVALPTPNPNPKKSSPLKKKRRREDGTSKERALHQRGKREEKKTINTR
jgi:hypothetical protein